MYELSTPMSRVSFWKDCLNEVYWSLLLSLLCFYAGFQVMELAENLMKQVPENIDYYATARILAVDPSPLNVVLLQEVSTGRQGHKSPLTSVSRSHDV